MLPICDFAFSIGSQLPTPCSKRWPWLNPRALVYKASALPRRSPSPPTQSYVPAPLSPLLPSTCRPPTAAAQVLLPSNVVKSYTDSVKPVTKSDSKVRFGKYDKVEPFTLEPMRLHYENQKPFSMVRVQIARGCCGARGGGAGMVDWGESMHVLLLCV